MASAGIVIIGDEILSGKFADENARYLIGELRALGVSLRRIAVIPDDVEDIARTVRWFSDRFDHVFTSGGVGPTHDDLTMEGIARAFDTEVVQHEELAAAIRAFFGPELGEKNLRLAEVPVGARLVGHDPALKWPVVCYHNVYILPGVPQLFRRKFDAIKELFRDEPFATDRVYCKADEGTLAPILNAAVADFPSVSFGSYPRFGESEHYTVIVTLESKDADAVAAAKRALANSLGDLLVHPFEP